jgi:8-oxo-dGTP pyrophosphatase MutT (NUDIX family)
MAHEAKIHEVQTIILRELLFLPSARFSDLRVKTNLDSDHFKFHVTRLVEVGYVEKLPKGDYALTQNGKEYANKLDTDHNVIERQPKSTVIIVVKKGNKVLVQERLKHPYFGFFGYPTGKIRWGETIIEAAERELMEETGLKAKMTYRGVYHEHISSAETGEILEDKIFHVVSGASPTEKLIEAFEGGRNSWMTIEKLASIDKKYLSADIETSIGLGHESFVEKAYTYTKSEF